MPVKTILNTVITTNNHVLKVKRCKNALQSRYVIVSSTDASLVNKSFTQMRVTDANNVMQFQAVMYNKTTPYVLGYFVTV
jgi:hypothetical protein